jgi:hypothetical protein
MQIIQESLAGLKIGAPQVHLNLALFPLLGKDEQKSDYVLLDEALERNLARVTEVSKGGNVPELAFENSSAEKILLVDGDELVGAKQNRIINLSILVSGGRKVTIPVSCVEQGRWSYRSDAFSSGKRTLFAKARAQKTARVSEDLTTTGLRRANQGEVWDSVSAKMAALEASSATMSMADAYESRRSDLEDYAGAFRAEPRQRGAVVAVDGAVVGLELFDAATSFAKYLDKLVRSYAMDALESGIRRPLAPSETDVQRFIEKLTSAGTESFEALGEGEDIRLKGRGISGGALATNGRLVHLAGYAVR